MVAGVLKGTVTIGIVCRDGVVLASDSQTTEGTFIHSRNLRKIYKIDENLALTIAGVLGDAQQIAKILKHENELYKMDHDAPLSPRTAAAFISRLLKQRQEPPFFVELLIGGVDKSIDSKPRLYNLDSDGAVLEESKFAATGSGAELAIGYLENRYKSDTSTESGAELATAAVGVAKKRNAGVGGPVVVCIITAKGFKELKFE